MKQVIKYNVKQSRENLLFDLRHSLFLTWASCHLPCSFLTTFSHNCTSFLLLGQLGTHWSPGQSMALLSTGENLVMSLICKT